MKKIIFFSFLAVFLLSGSVVGATASLSLSPSSGSYEINDTFSVDIMLNTNGAQTDGVDINWLKYSQNLLQVQGTQITVGSLYSITPLNTVNSTDGKIYFSQVTAGGTHSSSSSNAVLATINFKVLASGTATLSFSSYSSTDDCNVASDGADILSSATGASFTLGGTSYQAADLNEDGSVNSVDFAILMTYWGTTSATADINNDSAVNSVDFGVMMTQWGS